MARSHPTPSAAAATRRPGPAARRHDRLKALKSAGLVAAVRLPLAIPWRWRPGFAGWLLAHVVAPAAGYRGRIRTNLAYACPDLPEREVRRLCRAVPASIGRMVAEIASGDAFLSDIADLQPHGPGVPAIREARAAGRPIIFVSGHFGNFEVARFAMVKLCGQVGALYRPIEDPRLDAAFRGALERTSPPVFGRGRRGLAEMLRFLRQGNAVAIMADQYVNRGAALTFFGREAPTALSAAEMALKYDALLVPAYGIRTADGFDVVAEAPIPHSDARTMMQAVNDSLEAQVRTHMDQWLWIHRRWKPERTARHRSRAAATTGP